MSKLSAFLFSQLLTSESKNLKSRKSAYLAYFILKGKSKTTSNSSTLKLFVSSFENVPIQPNEWTVVFLKHGWTDKQQNEAKILHISKLGISSSPLVKETVRGGERGALSPHNAVSSHNHRYIKPMKYDVQNKKF